MIEKLRNEGDEEDGALWIERGGDPRVPKHRPLGLGSGCNFREFQRFGLGAPKLDAEINEVGRTRPFQEDEERGKGLQENAQPDEGKHHRRQIAQTHADDQRHRGGTSVGKGVGDHQQNGRPRNQQQDFSGKRKSGPRFQRHLSPQEAKCRRSPDFPDRERLG